MGDNTLNTAVDGTVIQAADVNQYKTALNEDIVPRLSTGVPTNEAGSVGTSLLSWFKSWVKTYHVMTRAVFGNIEDTSPDIKNDGSDNLTSEVYNSKAHLFDVDNVTVGKIDQNGVDGAYMKALSILPGSLETTRYGSTALAINVVNSASTNIGTVAINASGNKHVQIHYGSAENAGAGFGRIRIYEGAVLLADNPINAGTFLDNIQYVDILPTAGVHTYTLNVSAAATTILATSKPFTAIEV
jgi:hypothetical protein